MNTFNTFNAFKKIKHSTAAALLIVASSFMTIDAHAQMINAKIAIVNSAKIMAQAKIAKAADAKMQKEADARKKTLTPAFEAMDAANKKFIANQSKMNEAEKKKAQQEFMVLKSEFERQDTKLAEELTSIRNSEVTQLLKQIDAVIKTIAAQEKIDVIISNPIYASEAIDISDKVIGILNK